MNIWSDCKKLPLTEVLSFIVDNRGKTVPTTTSGHILIATNCIKNDRLYPCYEKIRFLSEDTYQSFFRSHPIPGDILFVCKGTPGRCALVPDPIDFCIAQDMVGLRANKSIIDNKYLLAVLRSYEIQKFIYNTSVGDVIPHFKKQFFNKLLIPVPPMELQTKIGAFYYSISQKIENNNKINANLEAQAEALFKSWFVDFTPFKDQPFVDSELGPIPQGWKVGKLGDYVEIKRGGSPRPIQKFLASQGLNWLKISDATSTQSPFIFNIKEKIIIDGLKKTVFLKAGSLVLSNSATPCIPKFLSIDSCIHDGWLYFPHSQLPENYLYLFFKLMRNNLVSKANGSVFLNLKTDIVKNQVFAFSGEEIYNSFDKIIAPLFKEIENLTYETFQLSALRDTLLPKLMSGEIKL